MPKRKYIIWAVCAAIALALAAWTVWSNVTLEVTEYTVADPEIPQAFVGFRIAQVSDLHNDAMGKPGGKLLSALQQLQPDIIAITGDLIDSRNTDIPAALEFVAEAVKIAPCYYVPGNHESRLTEYEAFQQSLLDLGVVVLDNQKVQLQRSGQTICLMGILDPAFDAAWESPHIYQRLKEFPQDEVYEILLSHRPELIELYAKYDHDLVLCGHTHGGQIRLPLIGSIFAPGQGFLPTYDAGYFEEENTKMIVSRGIGDSVIPLRFHNPPELVLITLTNNP